MPPKVSVIVTAYNHAAFIAQAVESILAQDVGFAIEILIGDDCSTDDTRAILQELDQHHAGRLTLVLPQRNLGHNGNALFVELLARAAGEYVALLDGDDYWLGTQKLQAQVELLDRERRFSMCFHEALQLRMDGTTIAYSENFGVPFDRAVYSLEDILFQNFVPTCSVVYRRGLIGTLPREFLTMPSGDWFLNVLNATRGDLAYIDAVWGVRRAHLGGVISMKPPAEKLEFNIECVRIIDRHFHHRYFWMARAKLLEYHGQLARWALQEGDARAARTNSIACLKLGRAPVGVPPRQLMRILLGTGSNNQAD